MTPSPEELKLLRDKLDALPVRVDAIELGTGSISWASDPPKRVRTQLEIDLLYGAKLMDRKTVPIMVKCVEDDRMPVEKQRDSWAGRAAGYTVTIRSARLFGLCGAVGRAAAKGNRRAQAAIVRRAEIRKWAS